MKKNDKLNFNDFLEIDENIYKKDLNGTYRQKSVYLIYFPYGKKAIYSNGVIKRISEDKFNIEHLCSTKPGASGCPIINLNNNRVMGIHKGADIKNWNLGTFIKEPIEKFYEENKKEKKENNEIKKEEKDQKIIAKIYEEKNKKDKKENNEINDNEKNKIILEDKMEKNCDKENDYSIELLPRDYNNKYDLSFNTIVLGDSGKIKYV